MSKGYLTFDGTGYVTIDNYPPFIYTIFGLGNAFSVSLWLRANPATSNGSRFFTTTPSVAAGMSGIFFQKTSNNIVSAGIYDVTTDSFWFTGGIMPWDNNWHHLVATFDDQYCYLYVDGKYQNRSSNPSYLGAGIIGYSPAIIGGYGHPVPSPKLNGGIDSIRVYTNYNLSASQVSGIYNKGRTHAIDPTDISSLTNFGWYSDVDNVNDNFLSGYMLYNGIWSDYNSNNFVGGTSWVDNSIQDGRYIISPNEDYYLYSSAKLLWDGNPGQTSTVHIDANNYIIGDINNNFVWDISNDNFAFQDEGDSYAVNIDANSSAGILYEGIGSHKFSIYLGGSYAESDIDATIKQYYLAASGDSDIPPDIWHIDYERQHAYSIYEDFSCIDNINNRLVIEPSVSSLEDIIKFSDKLNKVFQQTKITSISQDEEKVELQLDDRVITFIIDQSGSMTWNDNNGTRFEIIKNLVNKISENYPGEVKYNLVEYGSIFVNLLFFGIIAEENDIENIRDVTSLYLANQEADYVGIRVVRNEEEFPTSYIDGDIVTDSFVKKVFDDNLEEGRTYYYKVFTYDKKYRFSPGIEIAVTPRIRNIPRGISIFNSWINDDPLDESTKTYSGNNVLQADPMIGVGVIKDENTRGIWNFNEGRGEYSFDFSNSQANLFFENEPQWVSSLFVPSGTSAVWFNSYDTSASYLDTQDYLTLKQSQQVTLDGWVFPFADSPMVICMRQPDNALADNQINYLFAIDNGRLVFSNGTTTVVSDDVVTTDRWQFVAVTCNLGTGDVIFYVNGENAGIGNIATPTVDTGDMYFDVGYNRNRDNGVFPAYGYFYGQIASLSVHNIVRDQEYISQQVVTDSYIDSFSGQEINEIRGLSEDNGDRLIAMTYTIPDDNDFEGGEVIIVRNEKQVPTWEGDGEIVFQAIGVTSGKYYVTDAGDFALGQKYYYKIFSRNTTGNYNFVSDSSALEFNIPTTQANDLWPDISVISPLPPNDGNIAVSGHKKVYLRWNADTDDPDLSRIKIIYSSSQYPTIDVSGGYSGTLIFSGLNTDNHFVHRDIPNDQHAYYLIATTDKYGRPCENPLLAFSIPQEDSEFEDIIPVKDITNLRYEIADSNAVNIAWDVPKKHPGNIEAYFDQTVVFYALVTNEFGAGISEDTIIDMVTDVQIERESPVDNVFQDEPLEFADEDAYEFTTRVTEGNYIVGTLKMTSNAAILENIKTAQFTVRVQSIIPSEKYEGNDFEYKSQDIRVIFTNPWELILEKRHPEQRITERCYREEVTYDDYGEERKLLVPIYLDYDGVYVGSSKPFVARAKVWYKGEPVTGGRIQAAVWDAEADLCPCASATEPQTCANNLRFTPVNPSQEVLLPSTFFPIQNGTEIQLDSQGNEVEVPISYVDIPLSTPDLPKNVVLFAKGERAGFSSSKQLNVAFQSTLRIDLSVANAPEVNGTDIREQQSIAYLLDPDDPLNKDSISPVPDNEIVQWKLNKITGDISRSMYSTDTVPFPNGVFSYTRSGNARNIFWGPIKSNNEVIDESHEITASIVYQGMVSTARQYLYLEYDPEAAKEFGGRVLMEPEYSYRQACPNAIWTDGEDNVKFYISRDPTTSTTVHSNIFRQCAQEEGVQVLELNSSGQVVHVRATDERAEIVWGEVYEYIDPYTGKRFLDIGPEGHVDQQEAFILLNDEVPTDPDSNTTTFYVRINKFYPGSPETYTNCEFDYRENCDREPINLRCLDLTDCDEHKGDVFIEAQTTIFINGNPTILKGGGDLATGVIPCPIAVVEPLDINQLWIKVNGEFVDSFYNEDTGRSILNAYSTIEILAEVSFSNAPVPDGIPVTVTIGNDDGLSVFRARRNTVYTQMQDGRSVVYIELFPSRIPTITIEERVSITTTYDKVEKTDRSKSLTYTLPIEVQDNIPTSFIDIIYFDFTNNSNIVQDFHFIVTICEDEERTQNCMTFSSEINQDGWFVDGEPMSASGATIEPGETARIEFRPDLSLFVPRKIYYVSIFADDGEDTIFIGIYTFQVREEDPDVPTIDHTPVFTKTVERYNINDNQWETVESISEAKGDAFGGSVNDNIYIIGGLRDNNHNHLSISDKVEIYDNVSGSWEESEPMPTPRYGGMSVIVDSLIYTIGGVYYDTDLKRERVSRDVEVFDTVNNTWDVLESMPIIEEGEIIEEYMGTAFGTAQYVEVLDGSIIERYVYVLCGSNNISTSGSTVFSDSFLTRVLRYSIDRNEWEFSNRLNSEELKTYNRLSPLSIVSNDKIVVFNGTFEANGVYFTPLEFFTIDIYDDFNSLSVSNSDIQFGVLPIPKFSSSIVQYNGNISNEDMFYIIGGSNSKGESLDTLETIDIFSQPFLYNNSIDGTLEKMPTPKKGMLSAIINIIDEYSALHPYIYVIGGYSTGRSTGFVIIR